MKGPSGSLPLPHIRTEKVVNAFHRVLGIAFVCAMAVAPAVHAAPVDGFVATLTVTRDNGTEVARYNLLDQAGVQPGRVRALQNGDEAEPAPEDDVEDFSFFIGDRTLQLIGDVHFKTDPFVQFAFGIGNFTNTPLNYFFVFATPYAGGPYNLLTASLSSSVTDGGNRPNGAVTVDPFTAESIVDGTTFITLNTPCAQTGAPGFSQTCPNDMGSASLFSAATGLLSLELSFRLSPQDLVSINGRTDLLRQEVSEPLTLAMLSVGFVALAALRRRMTSG
jgi:hypothetical protein